jgi:hypothetical protein
MPVGDHDLDQTSVGALVQQLASDAREFATAEVEVAKAKALEKVNRFRNAGIFFGAAATLALSALTALLVGLILTVATLVGPGWATLIVIGVTLAIAGVLAMIGKGRLAPPPEVAK